MLLIGLYRLEAAEIIKQAAQKRGIRIILAGARPDRAHAVWCSDQAEGIQRVCVASPSYCSGEGRAISSINTPKGVRQNQV